MLLNFAVAALAFSAGVQPIGGRVLIPAQLFKAGDYPDKGVTISVEDLDGICKRFNAGEQVPIRTEHVETPLDPLGHVVALHREGEYLFGTLAFPVGLYTHIAERKADKVSVGLQVVEDANGKGYKLAETSLVFTPRVSGAGFLSPEIIAAKLAALQAAGKITPAMAGPAAKLYSGAGGVNFSDVGDTGAGLVATLDALFAAAPVVQARGPGVPVTFSDPTINPGSALDPTMESWAKTMGLDPARVAKLKAEG